MLTSIRESLAKRRAALGEDDAGFTLIELLVVVIIIGILAAIAIPIYINVQNSAKDASAQSDLTNDRTAVVSAYTSSNAFPTLSTGTANSANTTLTNAGWTGSVQNATTATATISNFCLATVSGSGTPWYITQTVSATSNKPSICTAITANN